MNTATAESKVAKVINLCTDDQLREMWQETERQAWSMENAAVRGWIFDAMEARGIVTWSDEHDDFLIDGERM